MLKDWNYLPVFKSYRYTMSELSNEAFGKIIKAAICAEDKDSRPEDLNDLEYMMYKTVIDDAERVYEARLEKKRAKANRKSGKNGAKKAPKNHYQPDNIDPDEALRLALARSFGEEDGVIL